MEHGMDRRDNMIEEEILTVIDGEKLIKTPNKPKEEDIFYLDETDEERELRIKGAVENE